MANPEPITPKSLAELARAGSIRSLRAVATSGRWALEAQIGMNSRPMSSKRDDVRLFSSLDSVEKFARETIGVDRFEVQS